MPIPFASQFFHDDGDGDGGDDAADYAFVDGDLDVDNDNDVDGRAGMTTLEDDDLLAGTQGQVLRKTRPENVHFAKKAKRVDVKRLKDDIWHGLKVVLPEVSQESEAVSPARDLVCWCSSCTEFCRFGFLRFPE
jgi:condensin complex subunit 2